MRIPRKAPMALATFVLAAATGHLMQSGANHAARLRSEPDPVPAPVRTAAAPVAASALAGAVITPLRADTSALRTIPDLPPTEPPRLASGTPFAIPAGAPGALPSSVDNQNSLDLSPFGLHCPAPRLDVAGRPKAILAITLTAPCNPSEDVTLRHAGLSVTGRTDSDGLLSIDLPALGPSAQVSARLASGATAEASLDVPGLDGLTRVVMAHDQSLPFRFGTPRGTAETLTLVAGKTLIDVYSARAGKTQIGPRIEAGVTADSCGKVIAGTVVMGAGDPIPFDIAMPGCDAIGDSVVLAMDPPSPLVLAGR